MRIFYSAILLAMSFVLLSCSNGPMLESGMFKQGYEEDLYEAAPPSTDISADEVELYCKDLDYDESIDCVASLNDKKQEDYKTWQTKKSVQAKQTTQTKQAKKTKQTQKSKQTKQTKQTQKKKATK